MAFRVIGRIVTHSLSFRWAIYLLIAITVIYVVVNVLWDNPDYHSFKRQKVERAHNRKRSSKKGSHTVSSAEKDNDVSEVSNLWVNDRTIQVISAISDIHHSELSETRVVLPAFLPHTSNREFVCCFQHSAEDKDYTQVSAVLGYIDLRFIVDLQNAAFECIFKNSETITGALFKFVSFAPYSCAESRSSAIQIVYPVRRTYEFAVCTKVAYGKLEPIRLVEWFEFMREVGASKILTFHNNLHPVARRVFDHYAESGYLELIEYNPQSARNVSHVLYSEKNSQSRQARHEKTLVVRDCQYRLAGYDFVLTIDFDELPVPMRPYRSLNWIFQTLVKNHTDGAAFRMDPILLPPEWQNPGRNLYHWQFSTGTYIAPYCVKWVHVPGRTLVAATHEIEPKKGFQVYKIPQEMLHFLHFRTCKSDWLEISCQNLTQVIKNEFTLKRFGGDMLRNLRKLPLEDLIPDKSYVKFVRVDSLSMPDTKRLKEHPFVNSLLKKE